MINRIAAAILLGGIQGIAEWLPISSSGHLALIQISLGLSAPVAFDALLHLATLLVAAAKFRGDLASILGNWLKLDLGSPPAKLGLMVLVGNVPTLLLGLALRDAFEAMYSDPRAIGFAFLLTGSLLYASRRGGEGGKAIGHREAILIGLSQGLSIAPGASRSGLTIATALLLGVERREAVRFSFLLMMPAVLGALALETGRSSAADMGPLEALAGFSAALAIGYLSLGLLIRSVSKGRFHLFSYYCWFVGAIALAHSLASLA
ncbi:MAG: undecaprenyl-diphosphate phosphatase [Candidatus Bathyarchaeia archaeon]